MNKELTVQELEVELNKLDVLRDSILSNLNLNPSLEHIIEIDHKKLISRETLDLYFNYWTLAKKIIRIYFPTDTILDYSFVTNEQKIDFLVDSFNKLKEIIPQKPESEKTGKRYSLRIICEKITYGNI